MAASKTGVLRMNTRPSTASRSVGRSCGSVGSTTAGMRTNERKNMPPAIINEAIPYATDGCIAYKNPLTAGPRIAAPVHVAL